jgi:hypothetical protein
MTSIFKKSTTIVAFFLWTLYIERNSNNTQPSQNI